MRQGRTLATLLVAASMLWPIGLGAAAWRRAADPSSTASAVVYRAASLVCHQRPERSFHTGGVQWPVCGRCSGLYLAAPLGAWLAFRRRRRLTRDQARFALAFAAVPTVVTLGLEWFDLADVSNLTRWLSALPLGATIALIVVRTADEPPPAIGYTGGP